MDHNDIEMTDLEGEQREIAECIGIDAYRALAQTYGGSSIYIAKTASILKDERDRRIRREYNGCNAHALAIKYDLADMEHGEIVDSVNYLAECGYIKLRHVVSQLPAALSDTRWEEIEAKLTADGIRLLAGCKQDACVEV